LNTTDIWRKIHINKRTKTFLIKVHSELCPASAFDLPTTYFIILALGQQTFKSLNIQELYNSCAIVEQPKDGPNSTQLNSTHLGLF
jgi:hypothetical protein